MKNLIENDHDCDWVYCQLDEDDEDTTEWKVWDYVVYEEEDEETEYIKINRIVVDDDWVITYNWYEGYELRDPIDEELNKYFR